MYTRGHKFLWLDWRKKNIVYFPREQVQRILQAKTEEFRLKLGPAPVAEPLTVFHRKIEPSTLEKLPDVPAAKNPNSIVIHTVHTSAAKSRSETLKVVKPRTPAEWMYLATQPINESTYYQVGPWVLQQERVPSQQGPEEFYFNVYGSANQLRKVGGSDFSKETGREVLPEAYAALWRHLKEGWKITHQSDPRDFAINKSVREILKGGLAEDVPASLSVIVACYFLAEVRRWSDSFPISLMLLDLVDAGPVSWDELMNGRTHPIARGGGRGNTPLLLPQETRDMGTDVVMEWLEGRSQPQRELLFETGDKEMGDPADREAVKLVGDEIQARLSTFESGHQTQHVVDGLSMQSKSGEDRGAKTD